MYRGIGASADSASEFGQEECVNFGSWERQAGFEKQTRLRILQSRIHSEASPTALHLLSERCVWTDPSGPDQTAVRKDCWKSAERRLFLRIGCYLRTLDWIRVVLLGNYILG